MHALSLAVFAFAVDDINARDLLMTSATPSALLRRREHETGGKCVGDVLLVAVELAELHEGCLLVSQRLRSLSSGRILVLTPRCGASASSVQCEAGRKAAHRGCRCRSALRASGRTRRRRLPASAALPWLTWRGRERSVWVGAGRGEEGESVREGGRHETPRAGDASLSVGKH